MGIKPLEELTIMDDYMFGVVMCDKKNLKPLLEYILKIKIADIESSNGRRLKRKDMNLMGSGLICT